MSKLAGGATLSEQLQTIFTKILSKQVRVDDSGKVSLSPAFETLSKVFTFVATPAAERPETGIDYSPELIKQVKEDIAIEQNIEISDEPFDNSLPPVDDEDEETEGEDTENEGPTPPTPGGGTVTPPADVTAPELTTSVVSEDGLTLTLTFNEALQANAELAGSDFQVDGTNALTAVISGSTVVLTLASAIAAGATPIISYPEGVVTDAAGNEVAMQDGVNVTTNNSTVVPSSLNISAADADGKVYTGEGSVTITGSDGNQMLNVQTTGTNTIEGGQGADTIILGKDDQGVLTGDDTVVVKGAVAAVAAVQTIDLSGVTVGADETFTISDGTNTLEYTNSTGSEVTGAALATAIATLTLDGFTVEADGSTTTQLNITQTEGNESEIELLTVAGTSNPSVVAVENTKGSAATVDETTVSETTQGVAAVEAEAVAVEDTKGVTAGTASDSNTASMDTITNFDISSDKLALGFGAGLVNNATNEEVTGVSDLTYTATNGILTFGGTAADTANMENKVTAAVEAIADTHKTLAFVDGDNTYVVQGDGQVGIHDTDIVVQLTGVTDLTDLAGVLVAL